MVAERVQATGDRVQAALVRKTLGLSDRRRRRLAGPPVVVDGLTLDTEAQLLLKLERLARMPDLGAVPLAQGRRLLERQAVLVGGDQPISAVRDLEVAGRTARHYLPSLHPGNGPLLVFFHGGGWAYGSLDSHDAVCRFLAHQTGVPVLSVDYRLAPEHPFPAAYEDCLAAYRQVVDDPAPFDADPARVAVAGDSAGGALAAAVALQAAREGRPLAFQLLVYPATDLTASFASRLTFGEGYFLTRGFMDVAREAYLPDPATYADPVASPLFADVPPGVAPAYVATAGFDPLRDEGEAYAEKLREAGVSVTLRRFPGQIHGFFNTVGVGRTARAHVAEIAGAVAGALRR